MLGLSLVGGFLKNSVLLSVWFQVNINYNSPVDARLTVRVFSFVYHKGLGNVVGLLEIFCALDRLR